MSNYGMPAGYDDWKLASPWDNDKPSDEIEVSVTFRLTEAEGEVYSATFTHNMRRDDAENLEDDLEANVEEFENEIEKEWGQQKDGDVLELV